MSLAHHSESVALDDLDMSQLRERVRELEALKDAHAEMEKSRDTFVAITSHQLRTPLSVLKWVLSVLQNDPELKKQEEKVSLINQAYASIERIIDTVNDLVNLARIQNGILPFTPVPVMLKDLVDEVVQNSRPLVESRGIKLQTDFAEDVPQIAADSLLVKEALQNLLNNAIDYNQEQGAVWITVRPKGEEVEIAVRNTGMGIEEKDRPHIFQPLFRSDSALRAHPDGSGLGLYLARAIAATHGGRLEFESRPGEETEFVLSLPVGR